MFKNILALCFLIGSAYSYALNQQIYQAPNNALDADYSHRGWVLEDYPYGEYQNNYYPYYNKQQYKNYDYMYYPYANNQYGQSQYGQSQYGQSQYGQSQYGQYQSTMYPRSRRYVDNYARAYQYMLANSGRSFNNGYNEMYYPYYYYTHMYV